MSKSGALVLDFGGVVSKTLFETHRQSEQVLGLPPDTLAWQGPFDPVNDPLWQQMQSDEISERDYWWRRTREVAELAGESWHEMSDFVKAVRGNDTEAIIRPEVRELVREVRQAGIKLAILSNELDLFYGLGFAERCAFLTDFDVIVDATYTRVLKPDPQAYTGCAASLGIAISECVFVDDQHRNVRGASAAGMQAVHLDVTEPARAFAQARKLLIED